MPSSQRYLASQVVQDLRRKMVFLGGPRQVGKTTLALRVLGDARAEGYLNWDIAEHRERLLRREFPTTDLWVFDELHKYRTWRNYLKGLFDKHRTDHQIFVTGSARLDLYRRGGDSLQGRYHYLRLHPLSVAELGLTSSEDLLTLLHLGGFPEPFFGGSEIDAARWSREYRTRLLQEDLLSLERITDIGNLELLILRLPECVGSPLSLNALREELRVSHTAVRNWCDILERLYTIFRLAPFGFPRLRAVKKEQKHYHYDWRLVPTLPARFENLMASHLLKWVHYLEDTEGRDVELQYFRDVDGREVDFIVTERRQPLMAVECKWDDGPVHAGLRYFGARFPNCPLWQVTATGKKDFVSPERIRVAPAIQLLRTLV